MSRSDSPSQSPTPPGGRPPGTPSLGIALGVVVVYSTVFKVIAASSGIPYTDWFATPGNVWRCAVLPLAGGTLVLAAFLLSSRWDGIFRDRPRLSWSGFFWVPVAAFAVGFVLHLVFVSWLDVTPDFLLPILTAGVLVGFCEETLFRGILLRSLRTDGRSEATAVIGTSAAFGLFHLTNIITGSPAAAVLNQVVLATFSGAVLYLFRRRSGLLVVGMIAHGLWDVSLFLPSVTDSLAGSLTGLATAIIVGALGLATLIVVGIRERHVQASADTA